MALTQPEKVDLFDPRQLAIGSVILAIGGSAFAGAKVSVGTWQLPFIATAAALVGILLNAIFLIFPVCRRAAARTGLAGAGE